VSGEIKGRPKKLAKFAKILQIFAKNFGVSPKA
jgi:hypothetical protein